MSNIINSETIAHLYFNSLIKIINNLDSRKIIGSHWVFSVIISRRVIIKFVVIFSIQLFLFILSLKIINLYFCFSADLLAITGIDISTRRL